MEAPKSSKPIKSRRGLNRQQYKRIEQMKLGPGRFVYEGGHFVVHTTPTVKYIDRDVPVVDSRGLPVLNDSGHQAMQPSGRLELDHLGRPQMGGKPIEERVEVETFKLWGVEFPMGVPVWVDDPELALKLRCLGACREMADGEEPIGIEVEDDEAPKKRGRKPKSSELAVAE